MRARTILYPLGLMLLAFAGSDIFKAEILTVFEISPEREYPSKNNTITVKNTGYLQADNVIILLAADKNMTNHSDMCAEGEIKDFDSKTLTAEFTRMSPHMPCKFELKFSEPASLNYTITADGRLLPWNSQWPWSNIGPLVFLVLVIAIPVLIVVIEVCFLYAVLKSKIIFSFYWFDIHKSEIKRYLWPLLCKKLDENKKPDEMMEKLLMNVKEVILYVKYEYGITIDEVDATILQLICVGKTTIQQLKNKMNLSHWHIKSRLNTLRKYELLTQGIKVHKTLADYVDILNKADNGSNSQSS